MSSTIIFSCTKIFLLNYSKIIFTEIFTNKENKLKIHMEGEILAVEAYVLSVDQNL